MIYMYKMAVIGDRDSVLGFAAIGLEVYSDTSHAAVARRIHALADEDCAIIFITEPVAMEVQDIIDQYKTCPFPAIIPIPNNAGSSGLGLAAIRSNTEKAIGSDIIFNAQ